MTDTTKTSTIPGDGPDAVLHRMASLMDVAPARAQGISLAVATHPRPTSLLAVVDIAGQLGLKVTPAKTNAEGLADVACPFVAHFEGGNGGGFGVVESTTASGFEVWDSANGGRVIDRDEFLANWSGVVVLMEPGGLEANRGFLPRVGQAIAGGETPDLINGPGTNLVRAGLGALAIVLVVLGVGSLPSHLTGAAAGIAVLAGAGLVLTSLMSIAIAGYGGPFNPGICRRGQLVDCQSVLTSRFAKVLGFPLADLGIAFYSAVLLLLGAAAVGVAAAPVVIGLAFIATVPVALVLVAIQIAMRRFCTLCLGVHTVNAAGAVVAWFTILDEPRTKIPETTLLFALFFALVLLFVVPYLKAGHALANLTTLHGRVSASPFGSLAQLTTERPSELNGPAFGVEIGGAEASDELVAFVHPSCNQCEAVLREVRSLAAAGVVHAYMAIPAKDESEHRLCSALTAIGLAAGPVALMKAFTAAKERPSGLHPDPEEALAQAAEIPPESLRDVSEEARAIARRTATFAAEHVEGTPMVFFNSLPYRGPIAHLMGLIRQHPELLPRPDRP